MRGESDVDILLVEDNPSEVELMLFALAKHNPGCHVHVARDGEEALNFIFCGAADYAAREIGNVPKAILLDLKLPKVGGLEVLRRIRGEPRTRTIPVVVLTSSDEEQDIAESYRLGANSYILKPVNFDQFMETMRIAATYWLVLNRMPGSRSET